MEKCNKNHEEIIHIGASCPLCSLTKHNNNVHDFIEKLGLQYELVDYQHSKNGELSVRGKSVADHYKSHEVKRKT